MKTIKQLLQETKIQLTTSSETPLLDAQLLLMQALEVSKAYLYAWPDAIPSAQQQAVLMAGVQRRRQGEPIAYILGQKEFWSLLLEVNNATLIPRPDTELLVELVLKLLPAKEHLRLLEIGTGSGAIACAIAKERPHWHIDASDISPAALAVAQRNATRHSLPNIQFIHSNCFNSIPPIRYAGILSNPPYLAIEDPHLQNQTLQFEPQTALVAGQTGLEMLTTLIERAPGFLHRQGLLILEHGAGQGQALKCLMQRDGFISIVDYPDINGHDRVLAGRLL